MAMALIARFYRPPERHLGTAVPPTPRLNGAELMLIISAALGWALFNAAYVVYLSFASKMLVSDGMTTLAAAAIVSVAGYIMMGSGIVCGQLAHRTKKPDLIVYVCLAGGIAGFLLLQDTSLALGSSLLVGLLGVAPAGLIVALSA